MFTNLTECDNNQHYMLAFHLDIGKKIRHKNAKIGLKNFLFFSLFPFFTPFICDDLSNLFPAFSLYVGRSLSFFISSFLSFFFYLFFFLCFFFYLFSANLHARHCQEHIISLYLTILIRIFSFPFSLYSFVIGRIEKSVITFQFFLLTFKHSFSFS